MEKSVKSSRHLGYGRVLIRTEDPKPRLSWCQSGAVCAGTGSRVFDAKAAQLATIGEKPRMRSGKISQNLRCLMSRVEFAKQFFKGDSMNYDLLRYIDGLRPGCKTRCKQRPGPGRGFIDQRYGILRYFVECCFPPKWAIAKPAPPITTYLSVGRERGEAIFWG